MISRTLGLGSWPLAAMALNIPQNKVAAPDGVVVLPFVDAYGLVELSFGGQKTSLIFDMGSPDTWVNPNCDRALCDALETCRNIARFDEAASSAFRKLDGAPVGELKYGSATVNVTWGYDTVTVGSVNIPDQFFGVAIDSTTTPYGILGLARSEIAVSFGREYSNIVDSLDIENLINVPAFGMDFNPGGSVTLGGIDVKKFSGPLARQQMTSVDFYATTLSSISTQASGDRVNLTRSEMAVHFDSGSTANFLPRDVVDALAKLIPSAERGRIKPSDFKPCNSTETPEVVDFEGYLVDCSGNDFTSFVDFNFGETAIRVPYQDLIRQSVDEKTGKCLLKILYSPEQINVSILGQGFLKNAYLVADWDDRSIYLGQRVNCGSELVAIKKSSDIASAQGKCCASAKSNAAPAVKRRAAAGGGGSMPIFSLPPMILGPLELH